MTLVAVWQRFVGDQPELVVASDSRLTGGLKFDSGPKLFLPPRNDCVLAFAGDTYLAYPLMAQIINWTNEYDQARSRAMDLAEFAGHCARLCSGILRRAVAASKPIPSGIDLGKDFTLVLAGYGWRRQRFHCWQSVTSPDGDFSWRRARASVHSVVLVGSGRPLASREITAFKAGPRLGRGRRPPAVLDWTPLDVLVKVIRGGADPATGGPPQLVKVFSHMNVLPYAIPWSMPGGRAITVLGRELLEYERSRRLALDVDSHQVLMQWDYLDKPVPLRADTEETRVRVDFS